MEDLHVGHLIEGHDVSFKPFQNGTRLLRRAGMGLVDGQIFTGLGLPVGDEGLVDLFVEFPRDVIGNVEDFLWLLRMNRGRAQTERDRRI